MAPKNYIPVLSGATYYARLNRSITAICGYTDVEGNGGRSISVDADTNLFTIPNDVRYIKFGVATNIYGTTYNNDISINYPSTDTSYHAYNGTNYTIQFTDGDNPLTVYGGSLDVVSGVLTVDEGYVDLGSLTWSLYDGIFYANVIGKAYLNTHANMICECYPVYATNAVNVSDAKTKLSDGEMCGFYRSSGQSTASYVYIKDSNYSTPTEFATALNGKKIVYELATPQTYQLTPTAVASLLAVNNVSVDTGEVNEVQYFSREV